MVAVGDPLVMILRRFGPETRRDAKALSAALRSVPEPVAISDIEALEAAVYSGAVDELAARISGGQPPDLALNGAADLASRAAGIGSEQARRACAALGVADGILPDAGAAPPEPPESDSGASGAAPAEGVTTLVAAPSDPPAHGPQDGGGAGQAGQLRWDEWEPNPSPDLPAHPPRRRWVVPVAVLGVLLLLAGGGVVVAFLVRPGPPKQVPPDPFAVTAVADRYRALGATLLEGATRCSPTDAAAGEVERVRCEFAEYDLMLSTYQTAATQRTARDVALNTEGSRRSARTTEDVAAFAMEQKTDGSSRVYWDVTQPRPVSATVSRGNTDLPDLIGWWDGRGFTALKRPEATGLPDDAFKSDELKKLASDWLNAPGAVCTSGTQTFGQRELVTCYWDNDVVASFYLAPDRAAFEANRQYYLSDAGTVSGTFSMSRSGGSPRRNLT